MPGKWRTALAIPLVGALLVAGCVSPEILEPGGNDEGESPYVPHVIVGVPDSGVNPYHEMFYRPNLTAHPCTYIRDFPCDVEELPLTVGGDDWDAAFEADKALWESVEEGRWYWIPRTVFVAVSCDYPYAPENGDVCILDDSHMHGTGTVGSVIMENPDALIAFKEGGSAHAPFLDAGIPVDVMSVSWGHIVPIPLPGETGSLLKGAPTPLYVLAAGNDPRSTALDTWAGDPRNIVVGGAYAADDSEEVMAAKQPDVVSYYCRPVPQTMSTHEIRESYCGTSFAAPTVAGALSKVVLGLRQESGYTGSVADGYVDPVLGVTVNDLRAAMNVTATYDPEAQYENTSESSLPLNPVAPWLQWGWGFYDGLVADATLALLLGEPGVEADKPEDARSYMETVHEAKRLLYGR